jgi:hypothetical protein
MSLVRPSEQLLAIPGESGLRRAVRRVKRKVRGLLARPRVETADLQASVQRTATQPRRIAMLAVCLAIVLGVLAAIVAVERAMDRQEAAFAQPTWRTIRNPQAFALEGQQLMQAREASALLTIPESEWPQAIQMMSPYSVRASSTQVRIALNRQGPYPEHGYIIAAEGTVVRDDAITLTADGAPGFFRYQAKE